MFSFLFNLYWYFTIIVIWSYIWYCFMGHDHWGLWFIIFVPTITFIFYLGVKREPFWYMSRGLRKYLREKGELK